MFRPSEGDSNPEKRRIPADSPSAKFNALDFFKATQAGEVAEPITDRNKPEDNPESAPDTPPVRQDLPTAANPDLDTPEPSDDAEIARPDHKLDTSDNADATEDIDISDDVGTDEDPVPDEASETDENLDADEDLDMDQSLATGLDRRSFDDVPILSGARVADGRRTVAETEDFEQKSETLEAPTDGNSRRLPDDTIDSGEEAGVAVSDAVPGKPPVPSDVEATDRADVARSADNPPTLGDSDGSIGQWLARNRSDRGLEDQEWGTGVDRLPNGQAIEYVVPYGKYPVEFDGHLFRGDPPVEVFQEVKGNYDFTYKPFPPGMSIENKMKDLIKKWVEQAQRQADVIDPTGADHEWILTQNPELVEPLQDALNDRRISVDVRYVPRSS